MISKDHSKLSISKQCELLDFSRSGLYYEAKGESELNVELMRLMDEHYLKHPYMGARRMYIWLTKDMGYDVSQNRVERLYYKVMCLRAVMPGPHTSKRNKEHKVYPYLLDNLEIDIPNKVWGIDITYIPLHRGYMYLIGIIDLYSRYVVNWSLSNTMEAEWCKQTVEEAIRIHGNPVIINTDQGSQFTSEVFTGMFDGQEMKLSMDGKGRAIDNVFIERLWRSVKYEKIYLNPASDGHELYEQLSEYFEYYNNERRHQSLNDETPASYYVKQNKLAA